MRGYQRPWLRIDVLAGLAAGTVVVPQAMAYATIAGLPVEVGLYTCMVPMIAYALLGGARTLSVSTTSTIAVLVASTLAGLSARSAAAQLDDAFTLTLLVGLCLLAMRLFRLGGLIENICSGDAPRCRP
jgi:SulP family sulfate permease